MLSEKIGAAGSMLLTPAHLLHQGAGFLGRTDILGYAIILGWGGLTIFSLFSCHFFFDAGGWPGGIFLSVMFIIIMGAIGAVLYTVKGILVFALAAATGVFDLGYNYLTRMKGREGKDHSDCGML